MSNAQLVAVPRTYSPLAILAAITLIFSGLLSLPTTGQAVETVPTWANTADIERNTFGGIFNTYQEKNIAFSNTIFRANGGNITYSVSSGTLPTGVSLDTATGDIYGTATVAGYVNFTITASNSAGSASLVTSMLIGKFMEVRQNPFPGTLGQDFNNTQIGTRGGSFSVHTSGATIRIDGALPAGVSYTVPQASTPGVIPRAYFTGTPTETGTFPLTLVLEDQSGFPFSASFDLVISPPVSSGGGGGDTPSPTTDVPAIEELPTEAELLLKEQEREQRRERRQERAAERQRIAEERAAIAAEQAREAKKAKTLEIASGPVFLVRERDARPGTAFSVDKPMSERLQAILSKPLAYPIPDSSEDSKTPIGELPELDPQQVIVVENGSLAEIEVVPSESNAGYVFSGQNWQVALEASDESGTPLALDESGNLILNSDRLVSFSGTGYAPGSTVKVWMFSDPTSVKEVVADAKGNFKGQAQIPAELPDGEHTLQLNGVNENGQIRSVAMGVLIAPVVVPVAPSPLPLPNITSEPIWALVIVLGLGLLVSFLWMLRRRTSSRPSRNAEFDNNVVELYPKAS